MESEYLSDFRTRAVLAVAATALVVLTPFTYTNLTHGHPLLGTASSVILAVLVVCAIQALRGRYHPWMIFAGLVPALALGLGLALTERGIIAALWCYPSVMACYLMLPERPAWLANVILLSFTLPGAWISLGPDLAARVTATLIASSVFTVAFVRVIARQQRALEFQATTDVLTGLSNRQTLGATLQRAVELNRRSHISMALLMVDVDHFKAINDQLGHDVGDSVLAGLGAFFRERTRGADAAFRFGGEEFLVLLSDTDAASAVQVAEDLRRGIAELGLLPGRPLHVSVGVACLARNETWSAWLKRSDQALYKAKAGGRNQVVTARPA